MVDIWADKGGGLTYFTDPMGQAVYQYDAGTTQITWLHQNYYTAPISIAKGADGKLYVADVAMETITKFDMFSTVQTVVTGADGLVAPIAMRYVTDGSNEILYGLTAGTKCGVWKVDMIAYMPTVSYIAGGTSCGYADATGSAAKFSNPNGIAITSDRATMFVADTGNKLVRKVNLA